MKWKNSTAIWISLMVLVVAVLAVCLPLLRPGFFVSDDGGWMIIRLSAFYQSFREGQFPVRFLGRLNYGYGYPVANFLYPGFMYIGSFIHYLGFPFIETVKIILGGSILTGTVFTYLWLRRNFTNVASTVGALGFAFAPYLLFDIYRRGSVGEVLALGWAAMGLYAIAAKKRWLFGLAVPLLILAHNSLALLFLGVYVLYITVLGAWPEFLFIFGAGLGLAAFFWFPAIYERKYVIFDSVAVSDPGQYFVRLANISLLGISGIAAAAISLFKKKLFQKEKAFFLIIFIVSIVFVLPVSDTVWQVPVLARIIQFPYRMLSVAVLAGAWLTAYAVDSNTKITRFILVCLFVGTGLWGVYTVTRSVSHINQPEGYYTTNEATTNVADEYMPKWVSRKPVAHAGDRLLFYSGRGTIQVNHMSSQTIDVVVSAAEDSIIQVNTLYYPGWGATVDNTQVRIDYSNAEDLMRIAVPAGNHHLIVAFRETISRFLADSVSLVSLAFYIVILVFAGRKSPKKK